MDFRWLMLACCSMLVLGAAACTSTGKCRRGELECACRQDGGCASGATCRAGMCVSATRTAIADEDAGSDAGATPALCAATSFDVACRSYCLALCRSEATFCTRSRCEDRFCEPNGGAVVSTNCQASCGGDGDPVACLRDLCLAQTRLQCSNFAYANDAGTLESACFEDDPACALTGT